MDCSHYVRAFQLAYDFKDPLKTSLAGSLREGLFNRGEGKSFCIFTITTLSEFEDITKVTSITSPA